MPKQKSESKATIVATDGGHFAVVLDGEIIRSGFKSRGHAAMWAARQKIYEGKAQPRHKPEIPADLIDERILKLPLAAKLTGRGYSRFLSEAHAGMWGELYLLGKISSASSSGT